MGYQAVQAGDVRRVPRGLGGGEEATCAGVLPSVLRCMYMLKLEYGSQASARQRFRLWAGVGGWHLASASMG